MNFKPYHILCLGVLILSITSFCMHSTKENNGSVNQIETVKAETSNKHALIIAIGDYNRMETGWSPISSQNDVPLIKAALIQQGFNEESIAYLKDKDADKKGILGALDELANSVKPGDMVVIHYSGHGQQIYDDNGDELDGYDESLVSIDAPARYHKIPGYTGQNHVRDEEFGAKINVIRKKVGKEGHVLVIMDSCHSGTGTRGGMNKARGGMPPLQPDDYKPNKAKEEGSGLSEKIASRGDESELGNFVLFAGARFDELNYETQDENGNGVGSLSYSFSKAMTQLESGETYRSLFAKVLAVMAEVAPNQSPMLEGDVDAGVFGGGDNIVSQTPYFNIKKINSGTEIIIDGGSIHSLGLGAKIGLFKIGTKNPSDEKEKLLIEGTISDVSTFSSTVSFESETGLKNERSAWVFVTELGIEDKKLKVSLSGLSPQTSATISEKLRKVNTINITDENPDLKVLLASEADSPANRGTSANGLIIRGGDLDIATDESKVSQTIENYARGQFLKKVEYWDDNYMVKLEFIPVEMKRTADGWEEVKRFDLKDYEVNGVLEFPAGTQLKLKVVNKGWSNAYFNVIDVQPDGLINPVAPNKSMGLPPEVCHIEAGEEIEIPNYFLTIGPPYGLETFKIFATKEQINLEPIINSQGMKGTINRGPNDFKSIEILMSEAYSTRGASGSSTSTKDGSGYNLNFRIVER